MGSCSSSSAEDITKANKGNAGKDSYYGNYNKKFDKGETSFFAFIFIHCGKITRNGLMLFVKNANMVIRNRDKGQVPSDGLLVRSEDFSDLKSLH